MFAVTVKAGCCPRTVDLVIFDSLKPVAYMQNAQIFCYDVGFLLLCLKALQIFVRNACHLRFMVWFCFFFFVQINEKILTVKRSPIFLCKNFPTESLSAEQEEYKKNNTFALVC